jgi:signal peptidase I
VTDESVSGAGTGTRSSRRSGGRGRRRKPKKPRPLWQEIPILIVVAALLSFLLQTFIARVYMIPSESMEPTLHGCADCTGDRIVVEKISYDFHDPHPGDVVVFKAPSQSWNEDYTSKRSSNPVIRGLEDFGSWLGLVPPDENDLVKRVIAVGGQKVQCCDAQGNVEVDGKSLTEPYINHSDVYEAEFQPGVLDCKTQAVSRRCFPEVTVPAGRVWVMGDNRANSADSAWHFRQDLNARMTTEQAAEDSTVPIGNVRGKAIWRIWPVGRIGTIGDTNPQSR